MHGKVIELFLVNGSADSLTTAELSNWNGKAIKIPRTEISGCHREDIKGVGVYFLMCQEDDGTDSVYIGEAENVLQRVWSVGKRICQRRRIYCFGRINCVGSYRTFFGNRRKGLFQS